MVASDGFADVLREQLAPLGHVALRRMFGKTGVFCDGLMLAMVREDALAAAKRAAPKRKAKPRRKWRRPLILSVL